MKSIYFSLAMFFSCLMFIQGHVAGSMSTDSSWIIFVIALVLGVGAGLASFIPLD